MFLYLWHLWFLLVQGYHLMCLSACVTVTWPVSVTWPMSVYLCHHSLGLYLYVCHSHMACVTSHVTVHLGCICLPVSLLPGLCHCLTTYIACVCLCHLGCVTTHLAYICLCAFVSVTQPLSLSESLCHHTHLAFMKSQQASLTSCRWRKLDPTRRD